MLLSVRSGRNAFAVRDDIGVGLCDKIGKAMPHEVMALFRICMERFPGRTWVFQAHDTYGFGVANVLAAYAAGVRVIDGVAAGSAVVPSRPARAATLRRKMSSMRLAEWESRPASISKSFSGAAEQGRRPAGRGDRWARAQGPRPGAALCGGHQERSYSRLPVRDVAGLGWPYSRVT
jgi:hypothetical protein